MAARTGSKRQECVVCDSDGVALCSKCQRDYDKSEALDGTIMAIISWSANRARAAEQKRAQKVVALAVQKWGAAVELKNSFEAVLNAHIGEKLTRLDAALKVVRGIENQGKRKS